MSDSKKVLFISYDGMTDPLGQSQVLPYLLGLRERGYEIHLLSFEKKEVYEVRNKTIWNIVEKGGITWYPKWYRKRPPIVSTILDVFDMISVAKALHRKHSFEIVHCRSYIAALAGQQLQKLGVKFLFDIRGFWADERVDGNIWSLKNPLHKLVFRYFKRKETEFFNSADAIVSLTNAAKSYIEDKFNVKDRIRVIPCAADQTHFDPKITAVEGVRKRLGLGDAYTLLYLGSIGTWYLLDEMLDFFKVLKKSRQDAKFLFVSPDPAQTIADKARQRGIDSSDIIVIEASRIEVPRYIKISDLAVFFIRPCFSKMASSPTKHGELLAMGVPVVHNAIGDLRLIAGNAGSNLLVKEFTTEHYQKVISAIGDAKTGDFLRNLSFEFYSLDNGIDQYDDIYLTLSDC